MSLIITICTSEGIVMASDSRTTYDYNASEKSGTHFSDTAYKTHLCDDRIGISHCGVSRIGGLSIASHIENYINNVYESSDSVQETATKLRDYFSALPHKKSVIFHVAGYEKEDGKDVFKVYTIDTLKRSSKVLLDNCGAAWDGVTTVLTRIIKNSYVVSEKDVLRPNAITIKKEDEQGYLTEETLTDKMVIPARSTNNKRLEISWDCFTLQDGIDFAKYAIQTTIDTMRFQNAYKTVGGPIDILVIKPNGAQWISHKELHA